MSPCAVFTLAVHAPTTQARKYVALLFCTDFALSFPRDVCRYICTKDHLMHGFLCVRQQATNMFLDKLLHASPSKYTDYSITDPFTQFRIFAVVKCVYVPSCGCCLCCVTLMTMVTVFPAREFVTISPVSLYPAPHSRGWVCGLPGLSSLALTSSCSAEVMSLRWARTLHSRGGHN